MNTTTLKRAAVFSGKGSQARMTALLQVAPLSFAEDTSRSASLANMRIVLGKSPTDAQTKAAKVEWTIGRVASRLPVNELPKGKTSPADRVEYARTVITAMAAFPKPGTKARKLRTGQVGRRTAVQQRIVRNADEACSQFFAELGLSNAKSQNERNAGRITRAPSMAGSGKGKAAATPPSHAALVKPAAAVTSDDYVNHMQTQLAALVAYDNKNARRRPTTHGAFAEQLHALRQIGNKAANDYQVSRAKADALAK